MSGAVRVYTHRGQERERVSVPLRSRRAWLAVLDYYTTLGWVVTATGCEDGALAIHLKLPERANRTSH